MLIILSQKIDTESAYSDELFDTYHYPARYKNQIHEGDTFVYYQGNRYAQEQRYYFGVGRIGKIRTEDGENYYAALLKVKRFKNKVPIYLSEGHYIEELGYETVRKSLRPPWQSSVRPLSQSAFDCIISRAEALLDVKKEETVEELKEKLKDAIRHFYQGNDPAIREIVDIASGIRGKLFPEEKGSSQGQSVDLHEESAALKPEEQAFLDYCRTTKMSYSYKMLLILSFVRYADKKGNMKIDDAVKYFRDFFNDRRSKGLIIEKKPCIYHDANVTDLQIRNNLTANPVKALAGSGYFSWDSASGCLSMEKNLWNAMGQKAESEIKRICEKRLKEYFQNG